MLKGQYSLELAMLYSIEYAVIADLIMRSCKKDEVVEEEQIRKALPFLTTNRIEKTLELMTASGFLQKGKNGRKTCYVYKACEEEDGNSSSYIREVISQYENIEYVKIDSYQEDIPTSKIEISEEGEKFAKWFSELLPSWMTKRVNEKRMYEWAQGYDELIKKGYTKQQIISACRWGRTHEFWAQNFFSPLKLLKKQPSSGMMYIDVFGYQSLAEKRRNESTEKALDGVIL